MDMEFTGEALELQAALVSREQSWVTQEVRW